MSDNELIIIAIIIEIFGTILYITNGFPAEVIAGLIIGGILLGCMAIIDPGKTRKP